MRSQKKATTRSKSVAGNTKQLVIDPEISFRSLIETYQVREPEQIKQKILWRYIKAIFLRVQGYNCDKVATVEHLASHDAHFRLCDMIIEHRDNQRLNRSLNEKEAQLGFKSKLG